MTVPVVLNAFDFFLDFVEECDILTWNTAAAKIAEKKIQLQHCYSSQKFGLPTNETMRRCFFFFSKSIFWRLLPWSKSFLLLWVSLSITIFVIKRNIMSRWLPKYLKQWRLFVDSAILHRPWLYYQPYLLDLKRNPYVNLQSTFLLRNILWINLETRNMQDDDIKAPKRNLHLNMKSLLSKLSTND